MNNILQNHPSQTAAGALVVAFSATMAASQAHWPTREVPAYIVPQTTRTYSSFVDEAVVVIPRLDSDIFAREIARVYAALSNGQEPLGAEFEAVWDANIDSLYES